MLKEWILVTLITMTGAGGNETTSVSSLEAYSTRQECEIRVERQKIRAGSKGVTRGCFRAMDFTTKE